MNKDPEDGQLAFMMYLCIAIVAYCVLNASCVAETPELVKPICDCELRIKCGNPPNQNQYPSLEEWIIDAQIWMTCARFAGNEVPGS